MHRSPLVVRSVVCLAGLVLASEPVRAQLPPGFDTVWGQVAERWRGAVAREGVVGASLALVENGRVARLEKYGTADVERGLPVDDATIYHWASITKTFTAVSILQLRDRGLLSLDDPVVRYVPELRDVHDPFGPIEEITIRMLLSHSAGFRAGTWPWGGDEEWHPYEPTEWSQLVAMMPYTRILFDPGSKFSYSNPGIIFLGKVIERVTGDVFEAWVDKNVFRPLGMRNAYFDATPWHLLPHRANHYFVRDGRPEAGGADFDTGITVSNGGLNAPIPDMVRWLGFLMGAPPDGVDADAVLARASLEEMWRTVVPIGEGPLGRESMGLSFFLYEREGRRLVGHTGTQRAFYSFFVIDPAARVGVIGAFNTVGTGGAAPRTDDLRVRTRSDVVDHVFPLFARGTR